MPEQSRQLVAIMFTDIVGYTALMGEDEQKAFELLRKTSNLPLSKHLITQFTPHINFVNLKSEEIKSIS